MHEWETNESRIKKLESTIDALKYHLEKTNELLQMVLLSNSAYSTIGERHKLASDRIEENLKHIKVIESCSE